MRKTIIILGAVFLLSACADEPDAALDDQALAALSETCRSAVSEQISRERSGLNMPSDAVKAAFDQRYRSCMHEQGYDVAKVTP